MDKRVEEVINKIEKEFEIELFFTHSYLSILDFEPEEFMDILSYARESIDLTTIEHTLHYKTGYYEWHDGENFNDDGYLEVEGFSSLSSYQVAQFFEALYVGFKKFFEQ
jgi:hypothetical protein